MSFHIGVVEMPSVPGNHAGVLDSVVFFCLHSRCLEFVVFGWGISSPVPPATSPTCAEVYAQSVVISMRQISVCAFISFVL